MEMKQLGRTIGVRLIGGEVIELIGDVGAGKTTLTKGLAEGLGISEPIQSPTFTISRVYTARDNLFLYHYDFYRLSEVGIMAEDVNEALSNDQAVTVIEWSGMVSEALPADRLQIYIYMANQEDVREVQIKAGGQRSQRIAGVIQ